jgi:SOS-response transcriptional repressor LexA
MNKLEMTDMRWEILEFVKSYHAQHGYAPSIQNIMDEIGSKSSSTVRYCLNRLKEEGFIDWTPAVARSSVPKQKKFVWKHKQSHE